MLYKTLSIAGFDGSGGAGIQADLKTFSALGCYGMTVLTALPVQNTCGVRSCHALPAALIEEQLIAIFDDITPDAIKIGMLFNQEIIETVAKFLKQYAPDIPIVLDPVTVAKSGDALLLPEAVFTLKNKLIPLATLVTPNLPEAYTLTDIPCTTEQDMPLVAHELLKLGTYAVLLKGGHLTGSEADDFYQDQLGNEEWLQGTRIDSKNTHGTGCTLSAAITSLLAHKYTLIEACTMAKIYLTQAISGAKHQVIGKGNGPVHHFYDLWPIDHTKLK